MSAVLRSMRSYNQSKFLDSTNIRAGDVKGQQIFIGWLPIPVLDTNE